MAATEEHEIDQQETPPESGSEPAEAASANGAGEAALPQAEAEELVHDVNEVVRQRDEAIERLQRAQAEFENVRKRLQREKEDIIRYAPADSIQSLLPVLDDFERAIGSDGLSEEFRKGLELIHRRIFEVFSRAGLKEVSQNDTFDPNVHCAVERAPAEEGQQDQQILAVYQKGYFFKDRLLRAAFVKVAVKE